MNHAEDKIGWLSAPQAFVSLKHEGDKVLVFDRAGAVFIFNFHPTKSFTDYRVGVPAAGQYRIALNTDESRFGGHNRVSQESQFFTTQGQWCNREHFVQVYIPCRTALVLVKKN
ncbi:alpha-1,4-glucan branching enzyme [Haplosporangium gracile]|nr:alpha-1,4-glucan branching enzyme [Haplosporangium gracile]